MVQLRLTPSPTAIPSIHHPGPVPCPSSCPTSSTKLGKTSSANTWNNTSPQTLYMNTLQTTKATKSAPKYVSTLAPFRSTLNHGPSQRPAPPGLSKHDAQILKSVQTRAHHLDKSLNLCGLRVGWSFFIALIPIFGSVADAFLNYYLVIRKARKANIPDWLQAKMILNSSIGVGASFVPFVGDIFLAVWKANSRNAVLLEEYLRIRGEELLREERERQQQQQRQQPVVTQSNFTATTTATTTVDIHSSSSGRNDKPGSFFSFSRWRARPKPEQEEKHGEQPDVDDAADPSTTAHIGCASTSPPPELVDDDGFDVPPSSLGHESEGGNGKKRGFFSSLSRGKAPPAGEKGRFVEHIPEANHEQWSSLPVQ